tara:strand:- start:198 stop:536 length:339 start_codon:yes stop_codon:yes gene_type:complete
MRPIIIQNSDIPKYLSIFININAITLYPFIISRGEMDESTINHEKIHIEQQKELWIIGFYLLYVYYWLRGKLKGESSLSAYLNIPFEIEAYSNETKRFYLIERKRHAWWCYR